MHFWHVSQGLIKRLEASMKLNFSTYISTFCCLKCFFTLKVLETWLGMLLFSFIFICITWTNGHSTGSGLKVTCLKRTSLSGEMSVMNENKSEAGLKLSWFGCSLRQCTVNWISCYKHTLVLPCNNNIWKYWQHEILKRPLFYYFSIMSLLLTALRGKTCRWGASCFSHLDELRASRL